MADDIVDSSGNARYRLPAIDARAFALGAMEQFFAQRISQPDANDQLGYALLARTRGENAQRAYMAAAQQQALAAGQQADAETARAILNARNPGLAYSLNATRRLIAPDRMEQFAGMADTAAAGEQAIVNRNNAQANQANVEAGVAPPLGTQYNQYSLPLAPRSQGVPLDLQTANVNAASRAAGAGTERLSALNATAANYARRAEFVAQETNRAERALLVSLGAVYDPNGNVVTMPRLTPQQAQEVRTRAEAAAQRAADNAFGMMDHVYRAGGREALIPPRTAAAPQVSDVPQEVAPAPEVPQQQPQQPRVSSNQVTPQMRQQIAARQPPGTVRTQISPTTGTVRYLDQQGNVLGTYRP